MATDYNDGLWHGWNGGEWPVHPKSKVEVVCGTSNRHTGFGRVTWKTAGDMTWDDTPQPIVAFRVVKPYREPLEFWAAIYNHTGDIGSPYKTEAEAVAALSGYPNARVVLFREVTEDDA